MQLTCVWKEGFNTWSIALSSHEDGYVINENKEKSTWIVEMGILNANTLDFYWCQAYQEYQKLKMLQQVGHLLKSGSFGLFFSTTQKYFYILAYF
jgi:hypothetical protein